MQKVNEQTFGKYIFSKRSHAGLSQAEVAILSGLSQMTISDVEREDGEPTYETAHRLAKALNIPASELKEFGLKPKIRTPFGKLIYTARIKKNWNRKYVEEKAQLSTGMLQYYENTPSQPSKKEIVLRLAQVLQVDEQKLLAVWAPKRTRR